MAFKSFQIQMTDSSKVTPPKMMNISLSVIFQSKRPEKILASRDPSIGIYSFEIPRDSIDIGIFIPGIWYFFGFLFL